VRHSLLPLIIISLIKIVALQLGDKHRITTPVNWKKGDDVIVHPGVSNDEAKKLFPDFTIHKVHFQRSSSQR
jgi:glutaredoxin/glutathione-dependent peroxiredoxin